MLTSRALRSPIALGAVLFALACAPQAHAFDPFVVRDIRIEGAQRIEPGTIFGYLPVKVGERFTSERATAAIQSLFATGFFRDVSLQADGDVLVVVLEERPAIGSIDFSGIKEFDKETVRRVMRDAGLAESRIFDRSVLDRAEQELKRQYLNRGKYAAKVTSTVTPLERNRVGVVLTVEEGDAASIASVRFVGNQAFSEATLLDQMKLSTPTFMSWYTKADRYSREKLSGDLETLRSFYLDRGFLEFNVQSTQVAISADRESIDLVIAVEEGERYTVKEVSFSGELLGRGDEFAAMMMLRAGDVFSGTRLSDSTKRITDRLGTLGYAFANVNAVPQADRERREVSFNVLVDPGRRAYVRRIDIAGNARTRDEVIRRELRQYEDAWYDSEKIRLSRERINRLGYFTDVKVETQPVPEAPDQVDLKVVVVEKPTGAVTFGLGFSSAEKVIITAGVNQQNFLGTGQAVGLEANTSRLFRTVALSFVDPYVTDDGVSRAIGVSTRKFNAQALNLGDYQIRSDAVGVTYGVPYTEIDRVFFGVGVESTHIQLGATPPNRYRQMVNEYGATTTGVNGSIGWGRDTRDSALTPTTGRLQRANFESSLPVAELRYWRATYAHQWYYPLNKDYTIALSGDVGHGRAWGGHSYPLFKNFYAGGIGSVRGFYSSSLGPKDYEIMADGTSRLIPLGGQTRMVGSAEFIFPFPGTGADRTIRTFLYTDVGNVFPQSNIDLAELRAAMGFGLNWVSPIGPMKLSVGKPVRYQPGDRSQRFQFQIGTGF